MSQAKSQGAHPVSVSHVTKIEEDAKGKFRASCACTWTSDAFTKRERALKAAEMHRANAKVQGL
jgi:hypothetical protein